MLLIVLVSILALGCVSFSSAETVEGTFTVKNEWPGQFGAEIYMPLHRDFLFGWMIYVVFDIPVDDFQVYVTRKCTLRKRVSNSLVGLLDGTFSEKVEIYPWKR